MTAPGGGLPEAGPAARGALVDGARLLLRHRGASATALLVGAMGALALSAGRLAAGARFDPRDGRAALVAAALFLLGGSVAALSWGASLAASLGGAPPLTALRRGTGAISLIAVERLIQFSLLLGAGLPLARWMAHHDDPSRLAAALAATAAVAPTLPLWMLTVPAFAIAVARAAAGEPPFAALPAGLALTLRHFGRVAATGLLALAATAVLWVPPLVLSGRIDARHHALPAIAATALAGALGMAASLLTYASLHALALALDAPGSALDESTPVDSG